METMLDMKMYKVECPNGHEVARYKTAVTYGEFTVYCPHCGASEKVTKIKE